MKREEALTLSVGDTLYHGELRQAGGKMPLRVRLSGRVRTWKRDPNRIEIPVKHGMYESYTITERDLGKWFSSEEDAEKFHSIRKEVPPREPGEEKKIKDTKSLFVFQLKQARDLFERSGREIPDWQKGAIQRLYDKLTDEGEKPWADEQYDRWKRKLQPYR
jgi:hypothetical protein